MKRNNQPLIPESTVKFLFILCCSFLLLLSSCSKQETPGYKDQFHLIVGNYGPASGWIFYINPNADQDGWKYLEAAPLDLSAKEWGTPGFSVTGADETDPGSGKQNTLDIVNFDTATLDKAAEACVNHSVTYSLKVYEDWYLPSKEELNLMYENLHQNGLGGFSDDFYWSSSEAGADKAWGQLFSNGMLRDDPKNYVYIIRAIRRF